MGIMIFLLILAIVIAAISQSISKQTPNDIVNKNFDEGKNQIINEMTNNSSKEDEKKIIEEPTNESYENYSLPPISLLKIPTNKDGNINELAIKENAPILEGVLKNFGIDGQVVAVHFGPVFTQYEVEIKPGTRISAILNIDKEIALELGSKSVNIEPIPGKRTIGIEVQNNERNIVTIREVIAKAPKNKNKLLVVLGKDKIGNIQYCEIDKAPHLLIAGTTGSGKSVCINNIIVSLLMRSKPDEVKLVLIDPKKVELSMYNNIPHLLVPVVTDPQKANLYLKKIANEIERRYDLLEKTGTKNIADYNTYIEKKNETDEDKVGKLPYIAIIIDELADLMLITPTEIEESMTRISRQGRTVGIHLIVGTERPSTDVITGFVKMNLPTRIALTVANSIDSRTILDMSGAEKLIGDGDMLFLLQGKNVPIRIQGAFISDDEIRAVVEHITKQYKPQYNDAMVKTVEKERALVNHFDNDSDEEPLYNEIVDFVVREGKASPSLLQRRFRIGYNRAARAIEILENRGIIGPLIGAKGHEVLVKLEESEYEE